MGDSGGLQAEEQEETQAREERSRVPLVQEPLVLSSVERRELKNAVSCLRWNESSYTETLPWLKERSVQMGTVLCQEGDPCTELHFIVRGEVEIFSDVIDVDTGETVRISLLRMGPGSLFGESAGAEGHEDQTGPCTITVKAASPVKTLFLTRAIICRRISETARSAINSFKDMHKQRCLLKDGPMGTRQGLSVKVDRRSNGRFTDAKLVRRGNEEGAWDVEYRKDGKTERGVKLHRIQRGMPRVKLSSKWMKSSAANNQSSKIIKYQPIHSWKTKLSCSSSRPKFDVVNRRVVPKTNTQLQTRRVHGGVLTTTMPLPHIQSPRGGVQKHGLAAPSRLAQTV
jgi:CRP-like cAMP-binding protein